MDIVKLLTANIMKFTMILLLAISLYSCSNSSKRNNSSSQLKEIAPPREVCYSDSFSDLLSLKKMEYAKSVGIRCVKISMNPFINRKKIKFKYSDAKMTNMMKKAKKNVNAAGINVWSVHMAFGKNIDLSFINENKRVKVVALMKKFLKYVKILKPEIINFHPSWFLVLGKDEVGNMKKILSVRRAHRRQLYKSVRELVKAVTDIGATMAVENMTGPFLMLSPTKERPLCRSVRTCKEVFSHFPKNVGITVDVNHIADPAELILAMGSRVKQVHMSNAAYLKEDHYFPCATDSKYQGSINWVAVLSALNKVGYSGPFVYEVKKKTYNNLKQLVTCHDSLYDNFIKVKFPNSNRLIRKK